MVDSSLASTSDTLFWVALVVYAIALAAFIAAMAYRKSGAATIATVLAGVGAAAHAGSMATRGLAAGRVPWGNMYEYSSMIALLLVVWVPACRRREVQAARAGSVRDGDRARDARVRPQAVRAGRAARPGAQLVVAEGPRGRRDHGVARSRSGSSSLLCICSRTALSGKPAALFGGGSTVGAAYAGSTVGEKETFPVDYASSDPEATRRGGEVRGFWARLPSSEKLDTLAFRTHAIAFPIWTFAVIAGAVWASKAWGRYWGWDPKETWAFITWTIYAGYLHARATAGWRGRKAAWVAAAGFVSLWITYYVVNLLIVGLHSYAN